jgi:hypothetical protein
MNTHPAAAASHELLFRSLFEPGRGLAFPCDAAGQVPLDALSERSRCNYDFARSVVGRDFACPVVRPQPLVPH